LVDTIEIEIKYRPESAFRSILFLVDGVHSVEPLVPHSLVLQLAHEVFVPHRGTGGFERFFLAAALLRGVFIFLHAGEE